jgi:hypothetical protein
VLRALLLLVLCSLKKLCIFLLCSCSCLCYDDCSLIVIMVLNICICIWRDVCDHRFQIQRACTPPHTPRLTCHLAILASTCFWKKLSCKLQLQLFQRSAALRSALCTPPRQTRQKAPYSNVH